MDFLIDTPWLAEGLLLLLCGLVLRLAVGYPSEWLE
jgi:hypothetical protein